VILLLAKMKDEYKTVKNVDGKPVTDRFGNPLTYKTDKRIRDGFERMRFEADIRLRLELTLNKDGKDVILRKATVVKNRFVSRTAKGWINELVGDEEVSWRGIIKLATVPKELGGIGLKEEDLR